jgi:tetratricopeptide (TPR) repeat protein
MGFDWPWFSFTWWPGYYDSCIGLPYAGDPCLAYNDSPISYVAYMPPGAGPDVTAPGEPTPAAPQEAADSPNDPYEFYGRAITAFNSGEYSKAAYMASHAAVDDPRSPKVHLLLSLALFATGDYRGAAIESHAVVAFGKMPDWPTVFALYGDVEPYTKHLRALEKYAHRHPNSAEARFLLGFHYLMAGNRDEAKDELLPALKLAPRDRLTARLLKDAGGVVPPDIAKQQEASAASKPPALPKPPAPQPPARK